MTTTLPPEIWEIILHNPSLNSKDCCNTRLVCSDFNELSKRKPLFKVCQFNRWVKQILDISKENILLQKLGIVWLKTCAEYFDKYNSGTLLPFDKFCISVVEYRNIFSEIISCETKFKRRLNGSQLLPPEFFLKKLYPNDIELLKHQCSEEFTPGKSKLTLSDVEKISSLFPECIICETNRSIIDEQLSRAIRLEHATTLVWTLRPSESEPGRIVVSSINLAKTDHLLISTEGFVAQLCTNLSGKPKTKTLSQIFKDHGIPIDPNQKLTKEKIEERKRTVLDEIELLHAEKQITFCPKINRAQAENLLKGQNDGVFLLRYSSSSTIDELSLVISVKSNESYKHIKIDIHPTRGMLLINKMLYSTFSTYLEYAKKAGFLDLPLVEAE